MWGFSVWQLLCLNILSASEHWWIAHVRQPGTPSTKTFILLFHALGQVFIWYTWLVFYYKSSKVPIHRWEFLAVLLSSIHCCLETWVSKYDWSKTTRTLKLIVISGTIDYQIIAEHQLVEHITTVLKTFKLFSNHTKKTELTWFLYITFRWNQWKQIAFK